MNPHEARAVLHLTSPVHVAFGDDVVHVRRMGLAILAYLALEGPTHRERLADVIWGHRQSLRNLRVELHRLREAFATIGMAPLQPTVDPLALAPTLGLAPVTDVDDFLIGLEDISADYQAWVDYRRDLLVRASATSARDGLLAALAGFVRPPFVLVVQGLPGSGRRTLAEALAHRLHLPFLEGADGDLAAVRYLAPDHPRSDALAGRIRHDRHSVWVIGRSAYGRDSQLLLRLRASMPPDHMHFETLRPLTWREAQRGILQGIGFQEGAALYVAACGHPGYLRELVAQRGNGRVLEPLPIPQRVRAAIALEAAHLSAAGALGLERLSVLGPRFPSALADAVGIDGALEELERTGWIVYEGDGWRFADPLVAKVLRAGVPPGQRARLQLKTERRRWTGETSDDDPATPGAVPVRHPTMAMTASAWTQVTAGRPVLLDEPRRTGDDVELENGAVVWSRLASANGPTGMVWPLPDGPLVVRLAGRAARMPDGTCRPSDDPTLLRLAVRGREAPVVDLAAVADARTPADGHVGLPIADAFERWVLLPRGARALEVTCPAAPAIVELEVDVHEVADGAPGEGRADAVMALNLGAIPASSARHDRPQDVALA